MVMDIISIAGSIASLTGLSIDKLLKKRWIRRGQAEINLSLIRILAVFEGNDPVVGQWEVGQWRYKPEQHFFVYGSLRVLFKYPGEQRWKALLRLTYTNAKSKNATFMFARTAWNRQRGRHFDCLYEIELREDGKGYSGASTMLYRHPNIRRNYAGVFDNLILKDGKLAGTFKNTTTLWHPEEASADVVFQQRKRWGEIVG
jgi:hypothetical protein